MAGKILIEVDEDHQTGIDAAGVPILGAYRLIGPNQEEGGITDWGIPAILDLGAERYMAFIGEDGEADPDLGPQVYLLTPVDTDVCDVEFEEEEGAAEVVQVAEVVEEAPEGDEDDDEEDDDAPEGEGGEPEA